MLKQSTPILIRIKTGLQFYLKDIAERKAGLNGSSTADDLISKKKLSEEIFETGKLINVLKEELKKRDENEG